MRAGSEEREGQARWFACTTSLFHVGEYLLRQARSLAAVTDALPTSEEHLRMERPSKNGLPTFINAAAAAQAGTMAIATPVMTIIPASRPSGSEANSLPRRVIYGRKARSVCHKYEPMSRTQLTIPFLLLYS
eukprot:RCo013823